MGRIPPTDAGDAGTDTGICRHADCGCRTPPGASPYCGAYCANAAEGESLPGDADPPGTCACGHAPCKDPLPDEVGREVVTSTGRT